MTNNLLPRQRNVLPFYRDQDTVATPSVAYQKSSVHWQMLDDLLGGTRAMREASTDWLPQEDKESSKAYNARLNRSVLHPMLQDTVDKLAGAPFMKPVVLKMDEGMALPEALEPLLKNADQSGTDLTAFTKRFFRGGVAYGMHFLLVDYSGKGGLSQAEQEQQKVGPYFSLVRPHDFVGFTEVTDPQTGVKTLEEVRIRECTTQKTGVYREETVEIIRVIRRGTQQRFQRITNNTGQEEWQPIDAEPMEWEMAGAPDPARPPIPLLCFYTGETGRFQAIPPLLGLAWLNVTHWQSGSDQRNILRFIRVGIMYMAGASEEEKEEYANLVVGANKLVFLANPEASIAHASYEGTAVEAGRQDLKDIEDRAEVVGLQPLVEKGTDATATKAVLDTEAKQSAMKQWVRDLNSVLREAFELAAMWINVELPESFEINIYSDFSIGFRSTTDLEQLLKARMAREISRQVYLQEIQRRGLISGDVDLQEEQDRLEEETDKALEQMQAQMDQDEDEDEGNEEE